MKAWSHLPNAHHIDWVLASLKKNPELWNAAGTAVWNAVLDAARDAARNAAWDAAGTAARDAARAATWSAAKAVDFPEAPPATFDAAMSAAWDVISALVFYDDCDQFLSMSYERLKVWAVLSENPRAVLVLPMIYVKEELANLNLQPA